MVKSFRASTRHYNRIAHVLDCKVSICPAFNHLHSPPPPDSAFIEFDAIWDTGASGSVITKEVAKKCGLRPIGMAKVSTANGLRNCNVYLVCIRLPNKVAFSTVRVTEGEIESTDILIGMDIIGSGDFAVTNYKGKTTCSYRVPSVAKIDYVAEAKKLSIPQVGTVGRNDPCPCGSGKKYKKCHGQNK